MGVRMLRHTAAAAILLFTLVPHAGARFVSAGLGSAAADARPDFSDPELVATALRSVTLPGTPERQARIGHLNVSGAATEAGGPRSITLTLTVPPELLAPPGAEWLLATIPQAPAGVVDDRDALLSPAAPGGANSSGGAEPVLAPPAERAGWRGEFLHRALVSMAAGADLTPRVSAAFAGARVPVLFSQHQTTLRVATPSEEASRLGTGERAAVALLLCSFLAAVIVLDRKSHQAS